MLWARLEVPVETGYQQSVDGANSRIEFYVPLIFVSGAEGVKNRPSSTDAEGVENSPL